MTVLASSLRTWCVERGLITVHREGGTHSSGPWQIRSLLFQPGAGSRMYIVFVICQ